MCEEFAGDDEPSYARREVIDIARLRARLLASRVGVSPLVVAVDGRSASGKSTLAAALAQESGWCVVATDDLAWWHSFFDWTDLLREVLEPERRGEAVAVTPPAWRERGRDGAVQIPAGVAAVVVEGVGSSREVVRDLLDVAIWVHAPLAQVEAREQERIATGHVTASLAQEWMTAELPFLADDRPWRRADLVVSGTDSGEGQIVLLWEDS